VVDEKTSWGYGRIQFLEKFDLIKKSIDDGWPVSMIYRKHKKDVHITYAQFCKYVNKFVYNKPKKSNNVDISSAVKTNGMKEPLSHQPDASSFNYQPGYDKHKLI
jgi:hypothetical protein